MLLCVFHGPTIAYFNNFMYRYLCCNLWWFRRRLYFRWFIDIYICERNVCISKYVRYIAACQREYLLQINCFVIRHRFTHCTELLRRKIAPTLSDENC